MGLRRQIRVGTQWLYADEAYKALREAERVMREEERGMLLHGHVHPHGHESVSFASVGFYS